MDKRIDVIGIDLAKNVFQLHAVDRAGKAVLKKKLRRAKLLEFIAVIPPCTIGLEACGSSHYWGQQLKNLGHTVKLMPPQYVKPYVKTNKNDETDAEAICEATTRPNMRFVSLKTPEQQAVLLLHRERDGLIKEHTALINRLRATLSEFGVVFASGPKRLHDWFRDGFHEVEESLPALIQRHVLRMKTRLNQLESDIAVLDKEIDTDIHANEACKRLMEVPGIGRLTASAVVASIGDGSAFKSSRQFAAWLGLVPRQHSSGGKTRLLNISKRGDGYLRRMFIHGARAVLRHMNPKRVVTGWLKALAMRSHRNVVIVALANKLARIGWAILVKNEHYQEAF